MMSNSSNPLSPTSSRLRIGVTGHRRFPSLSPEARSGMDARLSEVLAAIKAGCRADKALDFVVITSLAEGADRLVAEHGLAAGYSIEAVLPFTRSEYETDFHSVKSRSEFGALLARCSAVLELDGDAGHRPFAYEAAGLVLLSNIDVLLAIWDGNEGKGRGGTAEMVEHAIAEGIPVLWINPDEANQLAISFATEREIPLTTVKFRDVFCTVDSAQAADRLMKIVLPALDNNASAALKTYLAESRNVRGGQGYAGLLNFLSLGFFRVEPIDLERATRETRHQWSDYLSKIPADKSQRKQIEEVLLPAYATADHLAVHYANAYRGAYTGNFALAALAVTLALVGGLFFKTIGTKTVFVFCETLIAFLILFTWRMGHRREWHRRWLEYRRIAECLRQIRVLAPLALGGPIERSAGHLDPAEQDWANWYVHGIRRLIPLPDRVVDGDFLVSVRDSIRMNEIQGQIDYHRARAYRMHKYDHLMHRVGQGLFAATFVLCAGFLPWAVLAWGEVVPKLPDFWIAMFTAATVLLPTVGGALSAIHAQGDFKTSAEQSARIVKQLEAIDIALQNEPLSFVRLADRMERTVEAYMADVKDWHTVFRARPLSLPA